MKAPNYFFVLILGCILPYLLKFKDSIIDKNSFCREYFIKFNKIYYYSLNIIVDIIFAFIAFFIVYEFSFPEKLNPLSVICIGLNGRGLLNNFIAKSTKNISDKIEY